MTITSFLSRLNGVKRSGNGYVACCPAHDDKNPSLSVNLSDDGKKILINCFAGCADADILGRLGLKMSDLFIKDASEEKAPANITRYEYRDEDGTLLYTKTRYDKPNGTKSFGYMQPNGVRKLAGVKRVPYNLPAVCAADTVYFVEGEKCADAVISQGYTATTLDSGAQSKWQPGCEDYFEGKRIVILPDNDAPGAKYAQMVKRHLPWAVVKLLPDLREKGDVVDWLTAGHRMEEIDALPAFDWTEVSEDDDAPRTDQSSLLLQFAEKAGVQMFCDENKTPYAEVSIGGKKRMIQAESSEFSLYLQNLFFMEAKKTISKARLGAAMGVLISKAVFHSDAIHLNNRVAQHDNGFYYDLSDGEGTSIRASSDGWEITKDTPRLFAQYRHQQPQVIPQRGGVLNSIFQHINVKQYKLLFLCWLVSCFVPEIPHPITVIYGEKGAAKSTACILLKRLIDPSSLEALTLCKDEKNLIVALQQHYYLPFDNVSSITHDTSDTLCKAVMGAAIQQRKLYTNGEDYIFTFQRCISINGISNVANKADIIDRTIMLELERVAPTERRELHEVYAAFEKDRPIILGAIFETLSKAMQHYPTVRLPEYPRMADFCRWGYAISEALGFDGAQFVQEYRENSCIQNEEAINADSVAFLTVEFMRDRNHWYGRVSELLKELNELSSKFGISSSHNLPKSPCHLTRRIKVVKSNLEEVGITFSFSGKSSNGTYIMLENNRFASLPSYQIPIPESLKAVGHEPPDLSFIKNGANGANDDDFEDGVTF